MDTLRWRADPWRTLKYRSRNCAKNARLATKPRATGADQGFHSLRFAMTALDFGPVILATSLAADRPNTSDIPHWQTPFDRPALAIPSRVRFFRTVGSEQASFVATSSSHTVPSTAWCATGKKKRRSARCSRLTGHAGRSKGQLSTE
jgi:hypothetical protein